MCLRLCHRDWVHFRRSGRSHPQTTLPWISLPTEYTAQRPANTRRWPHAWPTRWYRSCAGGAQHDTHSYRVSDHAELYVGQCFCVSSWGHRTSTRPCYPFRADASAGIGSEWCRMRCVPGCARASLGHLSTCVCGVEVVLLLLLILSGNKQRTLRFSDLQYWLYARMPYPSTVLSCTLGIVVVRRLSQNAFSLFIRHVEPSHHSTSPSTSNLRHNSRPNVVPRLSSASRPKPRSIPHGIFPGPNPRLHKPSSRRSC